MDVHFGFRDVSCGKLETLILGKTCAAMLPWVFPVSGFADASSARSSDLLSDLETANRCESHDKARHPLMGLQHLIKINARSCSNHELF
jgi:hypothetical protein